MLRWALLCTAVLVLLIVPIGASAASVSVTFDDLSAPNRPLSGQYPANAIDWGANVWYLSGPWGQFTSNSIGFNGSGPTSASLTFVTPKRVLQIDAYNGGRVTSTVSLACIGQRTAQSSVAAGQRLTLATSWTSTCATVTVGSTNGWDTNFDNLVYDDGNAPLIANLQATSIGTSSATVSWSTNVAATTQLDYGTSTAYGQSSAVNSSLSTSHSVDLSGLSGGTLYHVRARSADASGNVSVSADFTFSTISPYCVALSTNPVACENSRPGDPPTVWDIPTHDAGDPSIQGFATDISFNLGDTVVFKINTPASAYTIDIFRMGYYQGNGARRQASISPSTSLPQSQPACLAQSATGLVDCGNWSPSASWQIPTTAVSGIYFAKLTRTDNHATSHIFFVVRDDSSTAPLLFQTSDTTWQAYNSYGGASLYRDFQFGLAARRASKVSYNRPFNTRSSISSLGPRSFVWNAEYPMVRWLEANGYNVAYLSGLDTDRNGAAYIQRHRTFLSVGQDEYWSGDQRANVEAARAAGVNLGFFSGNQTFWKTRWENSIDGSNTVYRTLVTYKETAANAVVDPNDPPTWTGTWRDPRFSPPGDGGKPENALAGQIFMVNGPQYNAMTVPYAYSRMRLWRNTAVASLAPGATATLTAGCNCLLGHEWDEELDNGSRPAGLIDLSSTTVSVPYLLQDYGNAFAAGWATHNLSLYRASSGALVFGAGTVGWAWGLDGTHDIMSSTPDASIQQATVNILADMGAQPATLQSGLTVATASTDARAPVSVITAPADGATTDNGVPVTVTGTATDIGGVVGGVEVSVDGGATWHVASGTTSWSYTWTPIAAGTVVIQARSTDDSANIETPSAGVHITVSGNLVVKFDDLSPPNRVLNGQYPAGVLDWGTNAWYLSGPWQAFTTNSVGFNGAGPSSATIRPLKPLRLVQVDAYNGGSGSSTVSIACSGQPTVTLAVGARQLVTMRTGWNGTCAGPVTLSSSNGWNTNFDSLVLAGS